MNSRHPRVETVRPVKGASPPIVVGVGASAGGLEAFTQLLGALPLDTGMGFVLVQHLDPDHKSELTSILARATSLPVREIRQGERVLANHVYVIPRDATLTIAGGALKLRRRAGKRQPQRSIDTFFESLAQDQGARAIGVVLSGSASDGTLGLEAIKAEGGFTFAQDGTARHDSMPRSAVAAGCVDLVLSPAGIARELARIATHPFVAAKGAAPADRTTAARQAKAARPAPAKLAGTGAKASSSDDDEYRKILVLLRNHSGVDFSLYKPATIHRRVARRLVLNNKSSLVDYARFLNGNVRELESLYADVLICVTSFFRNPDTFDVLKRKILPGLLKQRRGRGDDDSLRVWVLGCSTGQEAYSIAMVHVEAAEKAARTRKLQVFATDVNEALLEKARQGLYPKSLANDVTPQRLRRFFVEEQGGYRISKVLREMVVFARQNLIADPPFSRMDLISCRNLMIYLEPSLQQKAIPTFHYALKPGGFLMLGASESISGFHNLFELVDKKHRIYSRKPGPPRTSQPFAGFQPGAQARVARRPSLLPLERSEAAPGPQGALGELSAQREADRITVNQFGPPSVLVSADLQVIQFRGQTGAFLEPPAGKASFDVLKMAREGLMLPLRATIQQAEKENKTARHKNVCIQQDGKTVAVNLEVIPLKNLRERCFLIVFEKAGAVGRHPPAPEAGKPPGRTARATDLEAELAETREYLRSVQEQHEVASEELQSAHEEVQSANEELQSLNEELETSKEELESTNEELTTVNEELSARNVELNQLNNDLVNLQTSTQLGVVLLGRDLAIRRFSPQAERQLGLLVSDIGRPIGHLRHLLVSGDGAGTAVDLEHLCAEVIASARPQDLEVRDKTGRWHSLRAHPYRVAEGKVEGTVLVLVDISELKRTAQLVHEKEARYRAMFESTSVGVSESDIDTGRLLRVNAEFARLAGYRPEELVGKTLLELTYADDVRASDDGYERVLRGELDSWQTERRLVRKDGALVWTHSTVNLVRGANVRPLHTVTITFDISERKRIQQALEESTNASAFLAEVVRSSQDAILTRGLDGNITSWNRGAERALGYTAAEVLGRPAALLIPDDRQVAEAEIMANLKNGETAEPYETVRRRKDGSLLDVSVTVSAVKDQAGRVIGFSKILRDISESKRLEAELRKRDVSLTDGEHRKDEFLAMLGHELRNPLSALVYGLDLLGRPKAAAGRAEELRGMLMRQTSRMRVLIDQLLDVSRVTLGTVQLAKDTLDLSEIVRAAAETVKAVVEANHHTLTLVLPPDQSALVEGDAIRLTQVVENLFTNAANYTDHGGQIVATVDTDQATARVTVRDTGIGMSPDFLPHVFEAFTQAPRALDRAQGGLGIGLNLVQRLVELHGGQVTAASAGLGRGSEIQISLPRVAPKPSTPVPEDGPAARSARTRPLRILVVDDEEDTGGSFAELLGEDGHHTLAVRDGPSALEAARTFNPEVVLLDIGLPVMDGYEVARKLREEHRDKKMLLIAVTGYQKDTVRMQEAGLDQHLIKPPDLRKLSALLAAWNPAPEAKQ